MKNNVEEEKFELWRRFNLESQRNAVMRISSFSETSAFSFQPHSSIRMRFSYIPLPPYIYFPKHVFASAGTKMTDCCKYGGKARNFRSHPTRTQFSNRSLIAFMSFTARSLVSYITWKDENMYPSYDSVAQRCTQWLDSPINYDTKR